MKLTLFILFGLTSFICVSPSQAIEFHSNSEFAAHVIPPDDPTVHYPKNWDGTAAISVGCSGAVIQFSNDLTQNAIVLSNGHCYNEKLAAGKVVSNVPYSQPVRFFRATDILTRILSLNWFSQR